MMPSMCIVCRYKHHDVESTNNELYRHHFHRGCSICRTHYYLSSHFISLHLSCWLRLFVFMPLLARTLL